MLKYNKEENILYAFKNEIGIPKPPELGKQSIDYISFKHYLDDMIKEDVMNIFLPKLREIIKADENELRIVDIQVKQGDAGYYKNYNYLVQVKFSSPRVADNPLTNQPITILEIPMVDEKGIIYHDGRRYSLIKILEQDDTVSYDDVHKVLKLKLPRRSISINMSKGRPVLEASNLKSQAGSTLGFDALCTMFALAKFEGYDPESVYNEFRNYSTVNIYDTEEALQKAIYFYGSNRGAINADEYDRRLAPSLMGYSFRQTDDPTEELEELPILAITSIRSELNNILSLDRAIGKTLAVDAMSVFNPGHVAVSAGTVLTEATILRLKAAGVYNIFVDNTPNVEGYYLAQPVFLDRVPKGVKMVEELREFLPQETGMYCSRDYTKADFPPQEFPMFGQDTLLTKDLVELFKRCGYKSLRVCEKPGQSMSDEKGTKILYVVEEILSNRCFKRSDVPSSFLPDVEGPDPEWVYLNKDNVLVPCSNYITTYDIASLISLSAKLAVGECKNIISNIDTGFRKRVVMLHEQYHRAFENAMKDREGLPKISRKLKESYNNNNLYLADEMYNQFYPVKKQFFKYLNEAQCLEMLNAQVLTNPVSFNSSMNKINVFLPNAHAVSDEQRRIAIGSYGRIDPFETPQSHKLGVVTAKASGCEIDPEGRLKANYYVVKHMGTNHMVTKTVEQFYVQQEEDRKKIADMSSLVLDANGRILNTNDLILCRVPSSNTLEKQTFAYIPVSEITHVNCEPSQWISWASATIPFMGSNDSVRVIFGIAQTKAAKGLCNPDMPRVMTYANKYIPRLNDEFCLFAKESGIVDTITREVIDNCNYLVLAVKYASQTGVDEGTLYKFPEFTECGVSVTVRRLLVEEGDTFKEGQLLMTSNFINNGVLAMGANALVAYIPNGFNYEDGTHASRSFCDRLTSYRYNTELIPNAHKRSVLEIRSTGSNLYIEPHQNVVITTRNIMKSSAGKDTKHYTQKAKGFYDTSTIIAEKKEKIVEYTGVQVNLVSIDPFSSGDKMSNRHGNKGVMPKVEENSKMPRLQNGVHVDICYNPHGVISRMNIGQIKEANLGLVGLVLDTYFCSDAFNTISEDEIKMLLKFTVDLMNSTGDPHAICNKSEYSEIPSDFKEHVCGRINDIRFYAGCFDEKGEAYLINPKKGNRLTETKVLIGVNYVYKLIQESEKKLHVRGGMMSKEPYNTVDCAPTEGSSHHGGQKFGTMEMDALCAYGAAGLIDELLNERGDNAVARSNFNVKHFLPEAKQGDYLSDSHGQRRSTTQFLAIMQALGLNCMPTNGEFLPIYTDGDEFGYYTQPKLAKVQDEKFTGKRTGGHKNYTDNDVRKSSNDDANEMYRQLQGL